MTTDEDTIDKDVEKLAVECLRQMKKNNQCAPSFMAALIEQARADERAKYNIEINSIPCDKCHEVFMRTAHDTCLECLKKEAEQRGYERGKEERSAELHEEWRLEGYKQGQADLIEKIKKFGLEQMKKGEEAERLSWRYKKKLPRLLQKIIDKPDCGEVSMTWQNMSDLIEYSRVNGMSDWILVELYLSFKQNLGIELRGSQPKPEKPKEAKP
jgi:hypothetical protein